MDVKNVAENDLNSCRYSQYKNDHGLNINKQMFVREQANSVKINDKTLDLVFDFRFC